MTNVNCIGTYDTLATLWKAHPEGGIEGDYACVGDSYYGWDKYSRNWVVTTAPDGQEAGTETTETEPQEETAETETGTQAETETDEDIPAPNAVDINYLGSFASLADVWVFFPEGGTQGDYVSVGDMVYSWDRFSRNWTVSENKTITISYLASTPATRTRINYLGAFDSLADVWFYYPEGGYEGDYIHIGEDIEVWNKWNRQWGDSADPVSPAISSQTVDGDLVVNHNLTVAGTIKGTTILADTIIGRVIPLEQLPYRMEIDDNGVDAMAYGETLDITCTVYQGWVDMTDKVVSWKVERDTGDPAEDAAWALIDKAKNFKGSITIEHGKTYSDLGADVVSTLFTFTAYMTDGTTTDYTLEI